MIVICNHCAIEYEVNKNLHAKNNRLKLKFYCSRKCCHEAKCNSKVYNCTQCNNECTKRPNEIRSKNIFCSQTCSARYNNTHKTKGVKISKLELWLQVKLAELYPNLEFIFNGKETILSELDIYIPSLKLAFELNGIFHYEPIFGVNKLNKIQTNDISKSKSCIDNKIDLCIIDTSHQKYFKPSTSKKYLDIIINIIKERLLTS